VKVKYLVFVMAFVLILGTGLALSQEIECGDCSDCCKNIVWTTPAVKVTKRDVMKELNCNEKLCIPINVSAKVLSWGYIRLDYTKFDLEVLKPGFECFEMTNICTLSNDVRYLRYPWYIRLTNGNTKQDLYIWLIVFGAKENPVFADLEAKIKDINVSTAIETNIYNLIKPCCHEFKLYGSMWIWDDHQPAGEYKMVGSPAVCLIPVECYVNGVEL